MNNKVAVAMSGGVDSSVTVALLQRQGFEVQGIFMALAQPDLADQLQRVTAVADFLGVGLTVIDLAAEFKRQVLDYFCMSYFAGRTPNPCVVCNREIKFGRLLAKAMELGCDRMATGHYARLTKDEAGTTWLCMGADPTKDQSYFLHQLTQAQLSRLLMPLGSLHKTEVRQLAAGLGLGGRHGAESQDVCFLKDGTVAGFLAASCGQQVAPGPVLTMDGRELGRHRGIHSFTIGQRRGLGIPDATPYYVVGLDPARQAVLVGKEADLWHHGLTLARVNWTSGKEPGFSREFQVKIRYRHRPAAARLAREGEGRLAVRFAAPQRAITPGQYGVIYDGETLLGGGEIVESCP